MIPGKLSQATMKTLMKNPQKIEGKQEKLSKITETNKKHSFSDFGGLGRGLAGGTCRDIVTEALPLSLFTGVLRLWLRFSLVLFGDFHGFSAVPPSKPCKQPKKP